MSIKFKFLIIINIVFMVSCKNEQPQTKIKTNPKEQGNVHPESRSANSILEYRIANAEKNNWAALTHQIWEYEFVHEVEKGMSKPGEHAGNWIKFEDDNTYTYGKYDTEIKKGRYHYSPETSLLMMVPTNEKPLEWKVQIVNETMVYTGMDTYKDNNTQGKLKRISASPTK